MATIQVKIFGSFGYLNNKRQDAMTSFGYVEKFVENYSKKNRAIFLSGIPCQITNFQNKFSHDKNFGQLRMIF